jgi:endonuclease YncB( thermonuclease family)
MEGIHGRRRRVFNLAFLRVLQLALLVGLPHGCSAREQSVALVVAVPDGDSLVVVVGGEPAAARTRVRLAEIDAPERGQPWNQRSRQALRDKVMDKRVRLEVVDVDRYGRQVAHVWLGERHVNRELVREGHAWVYTQYLRDQSLLDDEAGARRARLGLWSIDEPVEPWRWRRSQGRSQG